MIYTLKYNEAERELIKTALKQYKSKCQQYAKQTQAGVSELWQERIEVLDGIIKPLSKVRG